jgi:hypothetical protein
MVKEKISILGVIALAAGFAFVYGAGSLAMAEDSSDYVEIDNPAFTLSPNASPTIVVPRSSVEKGMPRGSEIVKKGAGKVFPGLVKTPAQSEPQAGNEQSGQQAPPADAYQQAAPAPAYPYSQSVNQQPAYAQQPVQPYQPRYPAPVQSTIGVRNRVAIVETDRKDIVQPLYEYLRRASVGGILDPGQSAYLAQSANLTDETEKASFANRLQQEYGVNVVIFLSAPDGVTAGKDVSAEIYDAMAGGLLQKYSDVITQDPVTYQPDRTIAVLPASFPEKIREFLALLPWYGRITAVDGNRVYIAAGREAGLRSGQELKVYQSGKFIKGMGYAPGSQVGILIVQGFVGPNGSFGIIKEGRGIRATDLVSVD